MQLGTPLHMQLARSLSASLSASFSLRFFALCMGGCLTGSALAQASPKLSAPQWLVQHWQPSGAVTSLAEQRSQEAAQPASLTKLMTAYAVLRLPSATAQRSALLRVSRTCANIEGTRVGYRAEEQVTIADALQGMLAISGNDAACALAEHFDPAIAAGLVPVRTRGGPLSSVNVNAAPSCPANAHLAATAPIAHAPDLKPFTDYLNALSADLGLQHCMWRNPHGLSAELHLSSAQDIAKVAHALWYEFPETRPWFSRKTYTWNGLTQSNRNSLLFRDTRVDGLKTGHTSAAGYNLASTQNWQATVAGDTYDWRLTALVLGAATAAARADDSADLLAWARQRFQPWRLYAAHDLAGFWKLSGVAAAVPLHLKAPLWVVLDKTVPTSKVQYAFLADSTLSAPYPAGAVVGQLTASLGENEIGRAPVYSEQALTSSPWYVFTWAWVKSWFT